MRAAERATFKVKRRNTRVARLKELWDGLDARRRLIAALSVVAIVAAVFGISRVATEPSMAMLYSGLDATAAGEVVAELEAEGVAFEVEGAAIMVESAARDRIRMQLAAKGLPAGGPAGYEILDGLSGFGTTSQMFDAAYWRAKEGELARTITGSRMDCSRSWRDRISVRPRTSCTCFAAPSLRRPK